MLMVMGSADGSVVWSLADGVLSVAGVSVLFPQDAKMCIRDRSSIVC